MTKSIAATAGLAALLATAAPAQAQTSAGSTMSGPAKRLVSKVEKVGGTSVKARCRAPQRGRSVCAISFRASDGRRCADKRVTVVRRNGRMTIKGYAPSCKLAPSPVAPEQALTEPAPQGVPDAVETPAEMPGPPDATTGGSPIFDPGAGVPGGLPPGAESMFGRPPGAPTAKSTATAQASAENNSFLGCTNWQIDPWYASWWMYICYWSYSSAPAGAHLIGWQTTYVAQVYYWTGIGSQSAFWFRHEWTA